MRFMGEGSRLSVILRRPVSSAKVSICVQTNKDQGPYSSPCWGGGLRAILKGPGSSANVSICVQIEKDQGPGSSPGWGWGAKCNINRTRV